MGVLKNDVGRPSNKTIRIRMIIKLLVVVLIVGATGAVAYFLNDKGNTVTVDKKTVKSPYRMNGNSLEAFDLYFMQLENNKKNMVYSPLSIKYVLGMLSEGAKGETKNQITSVIGDYKAKKYVNDKNMSFANAMFIKDTYKKEVKDEYIKNLKDKYDAEVVYDSFQTPDAVNNWVSDKTLKLINNLLDKAPENDFMLANALAIDMEWINKIRAENEEYYVNFAHRNFGTWINPFLLDGYSKLDFKDNNDGVNSIEIGAVANKYDIINELGEENIRKTITEEYTAWLNGDKSYGECNDDISEEEKSPAEIKKYVDEFIGELGKGYKDVSSSTDFNFYVDDDVKVFAKDLKTYNNTTLQYIGIMPKKAELSEYIKNTNTKNINELINKLKPIELDSFKDGVLTHITGFIPVFKYDYDLNLTDDLNKIGITNVFDKEKADLTNLASGKPYIADTLHKATIDFTNDGIKASAVTLGGGLGDGNCGFDHIYKMPIEEINITFDNPYMYIIRDKKTGEVWFMGTVYEPTKYEKQPYSY